MNVVILTPALTAGDAVSNDVLGMAAELREAGHRVTLSVKYVAGDFPIVPVHRIGPLLQNPEDLLIYHHSIGCEEAVRAFEAARTRRAVKYHNVTPPEFFRGINPDIVKGCQEGARQVERLLLPGVHLWSDSEFNGRDLQARRPECDYAVLPPFNQVEALLNARPDLNCVGLYDDWLTNILVVGRVVPNKNLTLAVEAFARYHLDYNPLSRLIVVGDLAQNAYCETVLRQIRALGIGEQVVITGKVSTEHLKAFYLISRVLLTTSKHEGFCLPLVEGMGLRVPLVAVRNGAIPDTACGVARFADESAGELAAAIHAIESDPLAREAHLVAGSRRYREQFTHAAIAARFHHLVGKVLSAQTV